MPCVDVVIESPIRRSTRVRQLEGIFDVPAQEKTRLAWSFEAPLEEQPWSVGLIVGPSGSGKTTIARALFGDLLDERPAWTDNAVIDDFDPRMTLQEISDICQAVGFNTIPAWMRPYAVLSNGERFRVELARRLSEHDTIVMDEFSSVVDRQVGKIASHAVQKYVRRTNKRFVAVTCHHDVQDWLQPDWIIEPATGSFRRRSLQRRPQLDIVISPVDYSAWRMFAPYHYMSDELHRSARCFCAFVEDEPAAFAAFLFRPISGAKVMPIMGCSRAVTLPDYQGLGLIFVLLEAVSAAYLCKGLRSRIYPAHPAFVRAADRSRAWRLITRPGMRADINQRADRHTRFVGNMGGRHSAVFEFCGAAMSTDDATRLLSAHRIG